MPQSHKAALPGCVLLFVRLIVILNRRGLSVVKPLMLWQRSFGPLTNLFDEEEAALAVYEQSVAEVRELEGRWLAVSLALVYEEERTMAGQLPSSRMEGVIHLPWK
jgi:hypothetical protein